MSISRNIAGKTDLALVVTNLRIQQMSFHDGFLRILLFQIPKILKHPPQTATTTSTSGTHHAIMVMVHGDFTGRMEMMSGK